MKTKLILLSIVTAVSLLPCIGNVANAQITYNDKGINIRNAPSSGSMDLLIKLNGMYSAVNSSNLT